MVPVRLLQGPNLYPAILRVFERAPDSPLSAEEAFRRFRAQGGKTGPAAFYRALTAEGSGATQTRTPSLGIGWLRDQG